MSLQFPRYAAALTTIILLGGCSSEPDKPSASPPAAHIYVASIVPYAHSEVGSQAVQAECKWNRELPTKLAEQSEGVVVVDDAAFSNPAARRLILVAVNVHSIGGKGITGPKWAFVQGRLWDGNLLVGTFEISDFTLVGSFGACNTLDDLGDNIASRIAEWLKTPTIDPEVKAEKVELDPGNRLSGSQEAVIPPHPATMAPPTPSTYVAPIQTTSPLSATLSKGQTLRLSASQQLRGQPKATGTLKEVLPAGTTVTLDGQVGDYWFVKSSTVAGWLSAKELR